MIFIVNTLFTAAWMALIWRFDEFSHLKKSRKTLTLFMLAGMASMILVALGYYFSPIELISNNDDIESVFITHMLIAGPYEEGAKFLMFLFITRHFAPIKEPRDGILYAAAVAMGFAAVENLYYGNEYGLTVLLIRSALCTPGHVVYGAIWGFTYALAAYRNLPRGKRLNYGLVLFSLVPAAFAHGMYNFLVGVSLFPIAAASVVDIAVVIIAFRLYKYHGKLTPYKKYTLADYHEAVPAYRRALAVDPDNRVLNKRIALFYFYGNRFRESLDHIERLVRADPRNPYFHCLQGAALVLSGDNQGGIKAIARWHKRLSRSQREILKRNMTWLIRDISKREEILEVLGMRQVWVRWPVINPASE